MDTPTQKKNRKFLRWAAAASAIRQRSLQHAVDSLLPLLYQAGFQWVDKSFDCENMPAHTINLEREHPRGRTDYVMFIFDKHQKAKFQVLFGTKGTDNPKVWIRSGALVWDKISESVKYKWWGAKRWHLNKELTLVNAIKTVTALLPQVLRYLNEGEADKNIWESQLPDNASALQ